MRGKGSIKMIKKNKLWYTIELVNNEEDFTEYKEVIAKVKSQGLAYQVHETLKEIYKNTEYKVIVK